MAARFAGRVYARVTSHAGFGLHAHMVKARTCEGDGIGMAGIAWCAGIHMVGWFSRCNDTATERMTSCAIFRSALENPARMAGFALNPDMRTGKGEAGTHVVEVALMPHCLC